MQKNVGILDKNVRLLIGAILFLAALFSPLPTGWRVVLLVLAVIAFITGVVRL